MTIESAVTPTKGNHLARQKRAKPSNGHHRARQKPADIVWRMSVEQYHQMIAAGILTEDDPVELLEGWLIEKMPKDVRHIDATYSLRLSLEQQLTDGWYVNAQEPVTLPESEPEPDIFVVRGSRKQFRQRHPSAQDLVLIVEVAEATLQRDRTLKKQIYAHAGIPIYWIVNLVENQIEVYSEPTTVANKPTYLQRTDFQLTEHVPFLVSGEVIGEIAVSEVISIE